MTIRRTNSPSVLHAIDRHRPVAGVPGRHCRRARHHTALPKEAALGRLALAVDSLRADQQDPAIGDKGLLGNFFDLSTARRVLPVASYVDRRQVLDAFGPVQGGQFGRPSWPRAGSCPATASGGGADIRGTDNYGPQLFDGPLQRFRRRPPSAASWSCWTAAVPLIAFGDNANLSMSASHRTIAASRGRQGGDPRWRRCAGNGSISWTTSKRATRPSTTPDRMFNFGWDTRRNRLRLGDAARPLAHGHMDYLVNEFRGPATFVSSAIICRPRPWRISA